MSLRHTSLYVPSGVAPITGSGALASQAATMSGTANIEKTSSGALQAQAATISGTAEITKTGSGALASQSSTVAGTGTVSAPEVTDVNTDEIIDDGETGVTLTVSGFAGDITTVKTISGTAESIMLSLAGTGDNYTFSNVDITSVTIAVDGSPFTTASNAVEVEATDGTASATLAVTVNPKIGHAVQEITGAVKTVGSVFENFTGTIPDTSQVMYPTADNTTVGATGILTTDSTASIEMWYWDAVTEQWESFIAVNAIIATGALQSQSSTMAGVAERELTSSGALQSQASSMSGVAEIEKTGTGALVSASATMAGQAKAGSNEAIGILLSQPATMSGVAETFPDFLDGTGALILGHGGRYYSSKVG